MELVSSTRVGAADRAAQRLPLPPSPLRGASRSA